jgi:histidinol-phosphate/aromatic aminotransferase/cobyric acid decarboxylase-like protein
MNPFWSQIARELSPYVPGEQPRIANLVKLNTNESPFGPSPLALVPLDGGMRVRVEDYRREAAPNSRRRCANMRYWCGISTTRARRPIYASLSGRKTKPDG